MEIQNETTAIGQETKSPLFNSDNSQTKLPDSQFVAVMVMICFSLIIFF